MLNGFFDAIDAALLALSSQPVAVASIVFLVIVNAAIWLLVLERAGFPTALAALMLLPPLTLLVPLYVALARWPSQPVARFPIRRRTVRARAGQRFVRRLGRPGPVPSAFDHRLPLRLAADGLPRERIPLSSSSVTPGLADSGFEPLGHFRPDLGPGGTYS